MNCPACAHANRPGAKFCEECAAPLKRVCASCGAELRPSAKFCDECGTAVAAPAAPRPDEAAGARKVVTIAFADLVGSTALHERLDPESARRFMEGYYAAMRGAVESHGGTVTQFLGDGVKAVFGMPRVAEDDAIRAVRAAVAMQRAFRALAEQVQGAVGKTGLRVAVNTGEVVANDATEIIGDPVNVAARLQEQGRDGDVVVGESTQALVATLVTLELLGSFALKGRSEPVKAYRVISLERPAGVAATPFVGRDVELARISAVYETAVTKPAAGLAVLLGSPGLGKSRLIDELATRLGGFATVIRAHCDASGGASFAPLADALRALPDLDAAVPGSDAERARILDGVRALLAGSPAAPEETFFVVRRLLSALAASKPVVLVIDDLHWAEPLLLDLVEHLVQWGSGVPLLVLVGARPELREMRSSLAMPGGLVSEVITLAGLDAGAAMRLAANVIGAADLPAAVAAKVLATSEGNPLFVGELVRMLVHEGALKKEGERWTAGTALAALEMPPTIHALLAARIERLRPEERSVLERAAVIGRHFSRSAVAELLARDAIDLDARLESLRRAELIERDTGWFFGEPGLRFHHVLIRDAAYRRVLKGTRAELHARFAAWVETRTGDSIEHDETIGWHLEQAHQHLRELGPIDARGRALGARAAQRLAAAGRRALARDDVPLASGLLGRALDRLDRDDHARAELALDWCEALLAAGDVAPASAALEELDRFAASDARLRAWHTCFAGQLTTLTAPQGLGAAADAVAKAATDLAALGDVAGEAKAHFVHAQAFARLGKVGACEAALDRALAAARRADDRRRANTVLAIAPLAALWGPSPVTRASGRCLDVVRVLRITQGAPAVEAVALSCQGVLEALRGRSDAARRMIASARKMVEELGITQRLLEADVFAARIDLLDGDAASAERGLRTAYEGMRELGLGIDAARAAALLARALLRLDRASEAEALTHESERLAGDDLQAAIAWRGARAEALARRGETVEAVALATKAVDIAAATDALLDHADARLALAAALRAAGRTGEADTEESRANELWEAKGATLLAERARRESPRAAPATAQPAVRVGATRRARRRIRANRATAGGVRIEAAIVSRDSAALEGLISDPCVVVSHPTGVTYGRREHLSTWRSALRAESLTYRREVLGTLGDSLELWRHVISVSGLSDEYAASFGRSDFEEIVIGEDDGHGRYRRFEIFASDQLGNGIARLYERHAELLADGPERARAMAIARAAGVMLGQPDLAATATILAPDIEFSDLRTVGFGTLHGAEAVLETIAAMMELSRDDSAHIDDVVALESDALVVRWTNRGTQLESGGQFERKLCQLFAFGAAGLLSRWQQFEAEHDDAALARFDALVEGGAAEPFANAASRADRRLFACFNARDWDGVLALAAPELVFDERRRMLHNICGRDVWLEQFRLLFDVPASRFTSQLVATRGERLSLNLHCFAGEVAGGGGPLAMDDHYALHEVDRDGRIVSIVLFDLDDLDAAHAELDARFDVGEGTAHAGTLAAWRQVEHAMAIRDWDALSAARSPGCVFRDHRLLGWGTPTIETAVKMMKSIYDLAPDVRRRHNHVRLCERGILEDITQVGTRDGGAFEHVLLAVYEWDEQGRWQATDNYDLDQFDLALARFEEIRTAAKLAEPFANAASRADRRLFACFNARDWDGVLALAAPELVFDERRRMLHNTCGRDVWLEQFRLLLDVPASRFTSQLVATRGERLSLNLHRFAGEVAGGGGPLEVEDALALHEVDRDGRIVSIVLFDLDDLDAAHAELDARFEAGEASAVPHVAGALGSSHAISARDWRADAARYAPDFVYRDHRLLGWGSEGIDSETFIRLQQSLVELSPDARYRRDHIRISARGVLQQTTLVGTRDGGAFETPMLIVADLDEGRIASYDTYDLGDFERARARFDELKAATATPHPFANAASRALERTMAAWSARDWNGFSRVLAPEFRQSDRRSMVQLELDREQSIAFARELGEMASTRVEAELLATRGDRLSLSRLRVEAADGAVGQSEIESLMLYETNDEGEAIAYLRFDVGDEDAARAELDARYEAGEDKAHGLHRSIMRAFARAAETRDWDPVLALCAPALVEHDHRPLAVLGTTRGAEAWVQNFRVLVELAPDSRYRVDHFRSSARGFCTVGVWEGTREGGRYELPLVAVLELDDRKRMARVDIYDGDQLDRARARFDELKTATRTAPRFENAATRTVERANDAVEARDWKRFGTYFAAEFRNDDRRALMRLETDREQWLASFRQIVEMTTSRPVYQVRATRGERLALVHMRWSGAAGDIGPSEIDWLLVIEVNGRGDHVAVVSFDPGDLDAAYAELDARFEAGEGAAHLRVQATRLAARRAQEARDWDALGALHDPEVVCHDHRLLGWGTLHGVAAFLKTQQVLKELAPDSRVRADHMATCERGQFSSNLLSGTRDGGPFELPFLRVSELDSRGKICRIDLYDPSQLDAARARFDALGTQPVLALGRFENAASRAWREVFEAWRRRDMEGFARPNSPALRYRDRRHIVQLDLDREQWLEFARPLLELSADYSLWLLATRGERLALMRFTMEMEGDEVGSSAIDSLLVIETAESGEIVAYERFDLDDLDAAYAELDARFEAGEGAAHPRVQAARLAARRAQKDRDWDAIGDLHDPEIVCHDHRLLGWGTLYGVADFVSTQRVLGELAPDYRVRTDHMATCERGQFASNLLFGTRDGGPFELPFLRVSELDARGKICRIDLYDPSQLDAARVRFEEIRAGRPSDPLAALSRPNAASAVMERWQAAFDTGFASGDWEPMRALCAPDMLFDDRRRLALLSGDRELMIASARERAAMAARPEMRVVGTAGERVAIQRMLWSGGPEDGRFEIEYLSVIEVDSRQQISAIILLDPEDPREAQREAWARWTAIEPDVAANLALLARAIDAFNAHDLSAYGAVLADDLQVFDRRRTGMGRLDGAEAFLASAAALWELAPGTEIDGGWRWPAYARHGFVTVLRRHGTLADGGTYESEYLQLFVHARGRFTHLEMFELEALEAALARFEELRPDPLIIAPNAATRVNDRAALAIAAGDRAALRALASADFRFEDRGRRALVVGDAEVWLDSALFLGSEHRARLAPERLATLGDRIAVYRDAWSGSTEGGGFELGGIRVFELDAEGRLRALLLFDLEDRAAAFDEAFARFATGEAAGCVAVGGFVAYLRATNERDWRALRGIYTPDFILTDHRPLGLGVLDRERWVASLKATHELSVGLAFEVIRVLAWNERGVVVMLRRHGSIPDGGGPFENFPIGVALRAGDRFSRYELFDEAEAERAIARFEELCAAIEA